MTTRVPSSRPTPPVRCKRVASSAVWTRPPLARHRQRLQRRLTTTMGATTAATITTAATLHDPRLWVTYDAPQAGKPAPNHAVLQNPHLHDKAWQTLPYGVAAHPPCDPFAVAEVEGW